MDTETPWSHPLISRRNTNPPALTDEIDVVDVVASVIVAPAAPDHRVVPHTVRGGAPVDEAPQPTVPSNAKQQAVAIVL